MKKILKISGLTLTTLAPLSVVISCGSKANNDEHENIIKSINASDIFYHIKSDTNQLPSKIKKPSDFKISVPYKNVKYDVLAKATKWQANDEKGYIDYVMELQYQNATKKISGRLTDYITNKDESDRKSVDSITIGNILNLPNGDSKVLPCTVKEPTNLNTGSHGISLIVSEWDVMDSVGEIHYEIKAIKGNFSKTLTGLIVGYKTTQAKQEQQKELDSITHSSFENFPIANANVMTDDGSINWPDNSSLKLAASFNPKGNLKIDGVTWDNTDKNKGLMHWKIVLSHKELTETRTISGTISGFMTLEQKTAKDFINSIDENDFKNKLNGLPNPETSTLPSEEVVPTKLTSSMKGMADVDISLKMWDPRDSKGEIEYEVEVKKLGFTKNFIYHLTGYQILKDREDWTIIDSVHPESLTDFPSPNSAVLPSQIEKPSLVSPVEGMKIKVIDWQPNDYAGIITWKIETEFNGKKKETTGKIEGFKYSPWSPDSNSNDFPEGIKEINSFFGRQIKGNLVIPDSVEAVGPYFLNGTTIEGDLVLSNNLREMSWAMMWGVNIKGTLDLSANSFKKLTNQSFSRAKIKKLVLPSSIEIIDWNAFWEGQITDFTIEHLVNLKGIYTAALGGIVLPNNFALPPQKVELRGEVFKGSTLPNGFKIPKTWDDLTQLKTAFGAIVDKGHWEFNGQPTDNNEPKPGATYIYR